MNWEIAYKNTKTLKLNSSYGSTCKNCNDWVENTRTQERQMIGNCYQCITKCNQCEKTFVLDEHDDYQWFLDNKPTK